MYLPDTNIFIRAISRNEPEASFIRKLIEKGKLVVSVVVMAEFYAKASSPEKRAFEKILSEFSVVPIDKEVARTAGLYRKKYLVKTKKVFLLDCFLAAQAKIYNLTLVTNNKSDFPMKDIKIISPHI